jgi:colanic acid/amylovoran biosynthesis protein
MEMLDLKEYVLNISDITPGDLVTAALKCLENRSALKEHLHAKIPGIIEQAQLPARYISELVLEESLTA